MNPCYQTPKQQLRVHLVSDLETRHSMINKVVFLFFNVFKYAISTRFRNYISISNVVESGFGNIVINRRINRS